MDLDRYVDDLRQQLLTTAEAGGDDVASMAERLVPALESSVRMVLLEALADAAAEITVELAPGSVEVRLRGREPEIVVIAPPPETEVVTEANSAVEVPTPLADEDEGGTARITLRLPESLKGRVEAEAARQSLSVNAWLVRAVSAAAEQRPPAARADRPPSVGSRFTGWAR